MLTFKLTIAYDGSRFAGWARQPGLRTVQEAVEGAVARILGGDAVAVTVAGRTDAGVHALAQVASFALDRDPPERFAFRLNAVLPRDVSVLGCERVPDGFDARRWATTRSYRYRVLTSEQPDPFEQGRALWWTYPLDRSALDACAEAIAGEHDFTAFTPTQTEHMRFTRRVDAAAWIDERRPDRGDESRHGGEPSPLLAFEITADAFMRKMIRIMVGTMLEVGAGRRTLADFRELLRGAPRERAGETAPPHGLYFTGVTFGEGPTFEHPGDSEAD